MRQLERFFLLQVIDAHWREHLDSMDYLREGIHLRSMAQKDPLVEYRVEGHGMFEEMMRGVREEVVSMLFHVEVTAQDADLERHESEQLIYDDGGSAATYGGAGSSTSTFTPAGAGGSSSSTVAGSGNGSAADRPQRSLPLRLGAEVQALPRARRLDALADRAGSRCRGVEGPPGVGP